MPKSRFEWPKTTWRRINFLLNFSSSRNIEIDRFLREANKELLNRKRNWVLSEPTIEFIIGRVSRSDLLAMRRQCDACLVYLLKFCLWKKKRGTDSSRIRVIVILAIDFRSPDTISVRSIDVCVRVCGWVDCTKCIEARGLNITTDAAQPTVMRVTFYILLLNKWREWEKKSRRKTPHRSTS